jgi:hypothetical protein
MADQLDPAMVAQISEQIRRSMGGALVQVGTDLQKLDRISKDVVSSSGGLGKLDNAFLAISTRMLGPTGLVAGLYQVSNALSKVAADSVQMQAFSRNTGIAADNVKNMQIQLQMMGKSSEEAKATVGQLAGLLNDFNTNRQGSSLSQNLLGREGGAAVIRDLNAAKNVTEQIAVILKTYQAQPTERQRRGVAEAFGMDPASIEQMVKDQNLVIYTYKANEKALEEFHRASVIFSHNIDEAWKAVSGNVIKSLNDMTGGADGGAKAFATAVEGINAGVDSLLRGRASELGKLFNFGGLKQDMDDIKAFFNWWNSIEFKKNWESATGYGKYPQGGDPMEGTGSGKGPNRIGKISNFTFGEPGTVAANAQEQTTLLTEIRDTLQGKVGTGGSGGGYSFDGGGSGAGAGANRFGSANSAGGAGLMASRGATGQNTAKFMEYAKDELRKQGVPEKNLNHAAALLAGQAQAESNINPNLSHDGGTGYGIYGARNERRAGMLSWMKENGYEPNSLEGQTRYMAREAMTGKDYGPSRNALMNASPETMGSGTQTLTQNFERPLRDNSSARLGHAQAALNGGMVPQPGGEGGSTFGGLSFGGNVLERQGAVAGTRRGALDPRLRTALDYASSKTGLTADVTSGGQRMPGAPGAVGSHRHDDGNAGDFNLRDKDGNIVSPNDPRALEFYRYSAQAGVTGGGHSYMSDPNKIHLDRVGSVYSGGPAFRMMIQKGQQQSDEFAAAARERMSAKNSGTENSLNAKVQFENVPPGVKTSVESEGEIFKELQVSKSKQGEVAGGSSGQPFAGVW